MGEKYDYYESGTLFFGDTPLMEMKFGKKYSKIQRSLNDRLKQIKSLLYAVTKVR